MNQQKGAKLDPFTVTRAAAKCKRNDDCIADSAPSLLSHNPFAFAAELLVREGIATAQARR
jgi:hypothetical protein